MKKVFHFNLQLSLAVIGLILSITVCPTIVKAQEPSRNTWWTLCCKCGKGFDVDPKPPGYCRHCYLLCPGCRKELGDLDKAWEDLRNKNRVLLERMKAYQSEANRHNSQLTDALVKTYGQESGHWTVSDPSTWRNLTLSGYNSSFGKFTVAAGNLASDFGGGFGVGMLFNTLSTIQSADASELGGNISQSILDILLVEKIVEVFTSDANINEAARKLMEGFKRRQLAPAINQFNRAARVRRLEMLNKFAKGVNIAANLYGLVTAGADLLSNIGDIYDNYTARERSEAEREKLQEEIVKNADLLRCIKETQDSINHGGLGFKKSRGANDYAVNMVLGFILSKILDTDRSYPGLKRISDNNIYWDIDTIRIKFAISQLKKQDALLKTMINDFLEKVIPPLMPWILNRWKELPQADQRKLLQMAKIALDKVKNDWKQVKLLSESIIQNLGSAVIGYEMDYNADISGKENISPEIDKWVLTPNEKIKSGMGRLNMNFPPGVDWSVDVYTTGDKFLTNRSSFSKHMMFYDLAPGNYNFKLNGLPVKNVLIEKGKETKLVAGFLNIVTSNHWELHSESRDTFYKSGIKPVKFALPVGTYLLSFEKKDYRITIKDRVTVKFEQPISQLFDQ